MLLAATLAISGVWLLATGRLPGSRDSAPVDDPLASLDATEALRRAIQLDRRGRPMEGLRYYRHAARNRSDWLPHYDYAAALNNAADAVRSVNGLPVAETRSTVERVAMAREALDEFAQAERRASSPRVRATLIVARAQLMQKWGLAREAASGYQQAIAADSTSAGARKLEAAIRSTFQNPLVDASGSQP